MGANFEAFAFLKKYERSEYIIINVFDLVFDLEITLAKLVP